MIKKQSSDPDVLAAAVQANNLLQQLLSELPPAKDFDYGGHQLSIGQYGVCTACTTPIAEAQQVQAALHDLADATTDPIVKEHLALAAELFRLEAAAAVVRAELHNGHGTEAILNRLLGYQYERHIGDEYQHSHHQGAA